MTMIRKLAVAPDCAAHTSAPVNIQAWAPGAQMHGSGPTFTGHERPSRPCTELQAWAPVDMAASGSSYDSWRLAHCTRSPLANRLTWSLTSQGRTCTPAPTHLARTCTSLLAPAHIVLRLGNYTRTQPNATARLMLFIPGYTFQT